MKGHAPAEQDLPVTLTTLTNGLRVVAMQLPGSRVDYFGVNVNAGSRDDPEDAFGMAHMVEHTIFKGTDRHRSSYIINRMEAVGGELNAYTTKEETVVYTIAPAGNLRRSAGLVAELIACSVFPHDEVEREREVVVDEIRSYLDTPADAVIDDFEELSFRHPALAHNVLGSEESVRDISSERLREFLNTHYVPERMVVFYCGPKDAEYVVREVDRHFSSLRHHSPAVIRQVAEFNPQFDTVHNLDLHQTHTIIGAPTCNALSPDRYALLLMTNILGGPGMNSMLNVELREKRGLVYSVDASATLLSDCGMLQIYFGCDKSDLGKCIHHVHGAIRRLADGYLSPTRLERAKRQYLGQLTVAAENAEGRALGLGRSVQLYGTPPSPDAVAEAIHAVTAADIERAAAILILSRLTLT